MAYPGLNLFVIGFPFNYGQSIVYPIWKRGTIASDPNLLIAGNSKFWIDATTRQGMSGSPVFFRGDSYPSIHSPMTLTGRVNTFLIGIYSAQIKESELGVVTRLDKVFKKLEQVTP